MVSGRSLEWVKIVRPWNELKLEVLLKKGDVWILFAFPDAQNEYFRGAFGHRKRATLNPGGHSTKRMTRAIF